MTLSSSLDRHIRRPQQLVLSVHVLTSSTNKIYENLNVKENAFNSFLDTAEHCNIPSKFFAEPMSQTCSEQ